MFASKKILYALLFTLIFSKCSYSDGFPRGCEVTGFGYDGTHLVLNENGNQAYYLIQNRGLRDIELQRVENPDEFMSPQLTARLLPQNWAAFASDVEHLHFQCFNIEETKRIKVDCREILDVCQYPRAKFALSNMGNYWVSVNKDRSQIITDSTAKGIYLRW